MERTLLLICLEILQILLLVWCVRTLLWIKRSNRRVEDEVQRVSELLEEPIVPIPERYRR